MKKRKQFYAFFWKREVRKDYLITKKDLPTIGAEIDLWSQNKNLKGNKYLYSNCIMFSDKKDARIYLGKTKDFEIRKVILEFRD